MSENHLIKHTGGNGQLPPEIPPVVEESKSYFDDMEEVKINPSTAYGTRSVLTDVDVRKPDSQEWIRVNPDEEMQVSTGVFVSRKEKGVVYYVIPQLREELQKEIKPVHLVTVITSGGVVFLWPLTIPREGARPNAWVDTARVGCERAKTQWVRIRSDSEAAQYDVKVSVEEFADPVWPNKTFRELLKLAFKDRIIDSMQHKVVLGLNSAT